VFLLFFFFPVITARSERRCSGGFIIELGGVVFLNVVVTKVRNSLFSSPDVRYVIFERKLL
jgi:hypothetical protein